MFVSVINWDVHFSLFCEHYLLLEKSVVWFLRVLEDEFYVNLQKGIHFIFERALYPMYIVFFVLFFK